MNNKKILYRKLCDDESSIPLFSQAWWLDATAGDKFWDVALVEKNGVILAAMPYVIKRRFGLRFLGQPVLTQNLGPWLRSVNMKYSKALGQQKDLLEELISQLPKFDHFSQNWHYSQKNWMPFFWKKFQQTTKYTYVIKNLIDEKKIWSEFQQNIRTDIRKAQDRFNLRVRDDLGLEDFFKLNNMVFERQNKKPPYSLQYLKKLDQACCQKNSRRIFIAEDEHGNRHAGVYLVWDENSAYYLMGGGDPALRHSGATSLCMWEAIKFASKVTKRFDFEGSMLEPVERYFRAFGAEQIPYFSISKTNSRFLKTIYFLMTFKQNS